MVTAPPITAGVTLPSFTPSWNGVAPPIVVAVSLLNLPGPVDPGPGGGGNPTPVPPIAATAGIRVPSTWTGLFQLVTPEPGATVGTATPAFTIAVETDDPGETYTVDLQWATSATFTNPATVSDTFEVADGGTVLMPTAPLPAGTIHWRARLRDADGNAITGWRTTSFTVDTDPAPAQLDVTWTVDNSADRPIHLWHFDPPGPEDGDLVTVYGHGFPADGRLTFGNTELGVESWELVPASSDNTSTARLIDGPIVTCEHYEIVFAAPTTDGRGAALTVEE